MSKKMIEKPPKNDETTEDSTNEEEEEDPHTKSREANYLLSRISNPLFVQRMIESLPKRVKDRLNALKNLQMEYLTIETKFYEEVYALEKKYQQLYDPLLEKRNKIVNGEHEPAEAECKFDVEVEQTEDMSEKLKAFILDGDYGTPQTYPEDVKGVPDFWYNVFKNCDLIWEMVQEHDEPLIKKLKDIKLVYPDDGKSYIFEFHFDKNDYFSNEVLTKQYFLKFDLEKGKPFDYEGTEIHKCVGCKIQWAKGKDLTVRTIRKKQKHRSRGAVRMVTRQVPNDTFFNFFEPPTVPEDSEEMDPEVENILESDFNIGHYIRTRIIPRAALIYMGIINDDDEDDDDEEEEEGEEEESDMDEEDGSEMDDDMGGDAPGPKKHHNKKKGGGSHGGDGVRKEAAQPDCKQQ